VSLKFGVGAAQFSTMSTAYTYLKKSPRMKSLGLILEHARNSCGGSIQVYGIAWCRYVGISGFRLVIEWISRARVLNLRDYTGGLEAKYETLRTTVVATTSV
jgi:hypothetical protein